MNVTASINGLSLIGSGTALLTSHDLKLQVDELPISIRFRTDSGITRWATEGTQADGVIFTLFNMMSSHGEGIFDPVSIATSTEVNYFLSAYVTTLNKGAQRILIYNVFEKKANV